MGKKINSKIKEKKQKYNINENAKKKGTLFAKNKWTILTSFLFIIFMFAIGFNLTFAAGEDTSLKITFQGNELDPTSIYTLENKTMQLGINAATTYEDTDKYQVRWSVEDPDQAKKVADFPKKDSSSQTSQTIGMLKAKGPGLVTVTVSVFDMTIPGAEYTKVGTATCTILVKFSINTTTDDSIYKEMKEGSNERSLVLYSNSNPVQLNLNFGEPDDAQWISDNEEVVKITQNKGIVTPVGAGHTRIIVTYAPSSESGVQYSDTLDVYVIPQISETSGSGYKKSMNLSLPYSGGIIYTDTDFTNNLQQIKEKIVWAIYKDNNGSSEMIANSFGKSSDLISIEPVESRGNQLKVTGTSGVYDIYFYVADAYFNGSTGPYTPTNIHLTIKGNIENKEVYLGKGYTYDLPKAYNMTLSQFKECFTATLRRKSGTGSTDEFATLDSSTCVVTAKNQVTDDIVVYLRVNSNAKDQVAALIGDGSSALDLYKTSLNIIDLFNFQENSLILYNGQTKALAGYLDNTYSGYEIEWSSSDPKVVSVDSNGTIKALKESTDEVTITAVVKGYETEPGVNPTNSIKVRVESTIDYFELNPSGEVKMNVGETTTVTVEAKTNASEYPLVWLSSDESIFTVAPASDGKSALITATGVGIKGDGIGVLQVYNPQNGARATLDVNVSVPIESMKFSSSQVEYPFYKEGAPLGKDLSWTPTKANETDLIWLSSDTSVATVDNQGNLTFVSPGSTLIQVYPEYNPKNAMAQCLVTIEGSPTTMSIDKSNFVLNMGGDSQQVNVSFYPAHTSAELKFIPDISGIVDISYDDQRKSATITPKKTGITSVDVVPVSASTLPRLKFTVDVRQPATKLDLKPQNVTIKTGETIDIKATVTPKDTTDTIKWVSKNTSIATVEDLKDGNGRITGIRAGETTVEVSTYNGNVLTQREIVVVKVMEALKDVSLKEASRSVTVGSKILVSPIFTPDNAYDKSMLWSVGDSKIASITPHTNGSDVYVTGLVAGVTSITGISADGNYKVFCVIIVNPKSSPTTKKTTVVVTPKTKYLQVKKKFTIKVKVTSSKSTKVKWTSSKKKVATVNKKGKVTAKKVGTTYIKATAKDGSGVYARCKVIVVRKAKKVKLNKYSMNLLVGYAKKIKASLKPKNATIKSLKWTSSNKSIATVSQTGRVLGISPGVVKIKATTKDGSKKSATCIVTVKEPIEATGVSVENREITIAKGKTAQSGIKAEPDNTTTGIKYYSDNKKVATVNSKGKIKTKKAGQATIYGETANGLQGYVDVTVVDLNRKAVTLRQYDTETLHVNEISTGITWYSKNINVARIDASGKITARRPGTTIVYAVVNGVKLGCKVTVKKL